MIPTWEPAPEANPHVHFAPKFITTEPSQTQQGVLDFLPPPHSCALFPFFLQPQPIHSKYSDSAEPLPAFLQYQWMPSPSLPSPHCGCFAERTLHSSDSPQGSSSCASQQPIGTPRGRPLPSCGGTDWWRWQAGRHQQQDARPRPKFTCKIRGVF